MVDGRREDGDGRGSAGEGAVGLWAADVDVEKDDAMRGGDNDGGSLCGGLLEIWRYSK